METPLWVQSNLMRGDIYVKGGRRWRGLSEGSRIWNPESTLDNPRRQKWGQRAAPRKEARMAWNPYLRDSRAHIFSYVNTSDIGTCGRSMASYNGQLACLFVSDFLSLVLWKIIVHLPTTGTLNSWKQKYWRTEEQGVGNILKEQVAITHTHSYRLSVITVSGAGTRDFRARLKGTEALWGGQEGEKGWWSCSFTVQLRPQPEPSLGNRHTTSPPRSK